jgi:hypothetical protein
MPGRGTEPAPAPLFADIADRGADTGEVTGDPAAGERGTEAEPAGPPDTPAPDPDQAPRTPPPSEPPPHDPGAKGDSPVAAGTIERVPGRRRAARYGLLIQFESRPGDLELARLVDSTIWINEAHHAYTRALASRSVGYHTALAVALALAPLAVAPAEEHAFITQFLSQWGGAPGRAARRSVRRRRRKSGEGELL